jgi:hypothetical protein
MKCDILVSRAFAFEMQLAPLHRGDGGAVRLDAGAGVPVHAGQPSGIIGAAVPQEAGLALFTALISRDVILQPRHQLMAAKCGPCTNLTPGSDMPSRAYGPMAASPVHVTNLTPGSERGP